MWILVLGMHRSGTSAVAGILASLGFQLGDPKFTMSPATDNPKGFWERTDVLAVNDELLTRIGCTWDRLARYHPARMLAAGSPECSRKITNILDPQNKHSPEFIKDPRMCLTFPIWDQVCPPTAIIWVIRNPVEVARSLKKRNDCSFSTGVAMWELYNRAIYSALNHRPVLRVHFDELENDPLRGSQIIMEFLCQQGLSVATYQPAIVSQWFETNLINHHMSPSDMDMVLPEIKSFYDLLRRPQLPPASEPFKLSLLANAELADHEYGRCKERDEIKHLSKRLREREQQIQGQLAQLCDAQTALEQSTMWRGIRVLHKAWCMLIGQAGACTPMDKLKAVLEEMSHREQP